MKKQLGPSDSIFPVPAALIVSGVNEEANIITIARIGIPSPTPPTIGISVKNSRSWNAHIRNVCGNNSFYDDLLNFPYESLCLVQISGYT